MGDQNLEKKDRAGLNVNNSEVGFELKLAVMLMIITIVKSLSLPRWSRGNVLASRSKVRGFKPLLRSMDFSGRQNSEHKSSGRDFKLGSRVSDFRLVK